MNGAVEIRCAAPEEGEAILSIQKLAYQSEAALYPGHHLPPLHETVEDLLTAFDTHLVLVACVEGKVVGSIRGTVTEGTCHVGRLSIHPDFQKRGIGAALLAEIEHRHPAVERFELFTGARSEGNIRLYQRAGYCPVKTVEIEPGVALVFLEKSS
jgi:ribosomal protein S18 acetylase RimI-like enzyme